MRSFGHGIKHLLLAVIWLAALVCITEVALRAQRWRAVAYPQPGVAEPVGDRRTGARRRISSCVR
jgi:hypothetical protein